MGVNSSQGAYCINGRFLTRDITGVDRYAREIVSALDCLMEGGEACILIPEYANVIDCPRYKNIELIRYGTRNGHAWEQFDLYQYAKRRKLVTINLCNTAPILDPGVVCIHDMNIRANPKFYNWKFRMAYRWYFQLFARRARLILTVSDFSKNEIEKYYPSARGKIHVVPNAWQHIERTKPDYSIFSRSDLEPGSYYFAMSSLAPNKNLKWIVETACLNPSDTFAVAGGINLKVFGEHDIPKAENVKYLGYVTDGEAKALMASCKCFLYPTFYEGFGIPPMEALACGARSVMVSDTEVMHEVYGVDVQYINPRLPQLMDCMRCEHVFDNRPGVLDRYSWKKSAGMLRSILQSKIELGG